MDTAELYWSWLNGLVRRASVGVLFFLFFAVTSFLLFLAAYDRDTGLSHLGDYSREHSRFSESFLDIADHATEVAGARSRANALSAVQPLRRSLISARDKEISELSCAETWIDGLRKFQEIPAKVSRSCMPSGDECTVPHDELLLEDLIAFEKGMASVQDLLSTLDQFCFSEAAEDDVCGYYRAHREGEISALQGLVGSHYREQREMRSRRRTRATGEECAADHTSLISAERFVDAVDPTARPRSLADFERLGKSITARRVAIESEDTRVSSAPAGGLLTVLLPRNVSFPLLHFLALAAALYALLHIRRLRRLTTAHSLGDERKLYRLYPVASHVFTAPVFGRSHEADSDQTLVTRAAAQITSFLFDSLPLAAVTVSALGVVGATILHTGGSISFSAGSLIVSWLLLVAQLVSARAYAAEQRAVKTHYRAWASDPPAPEQSQGERS